MRLRATPCQSPPTALCGPTAFSFSSIFAFDFQVCFVKRTDRVSSRPTNQTNHTTRILPSLGQRCSVATTSLCCVPVYDGPIYIQPFTCNCSTTTTYVVCFIRTTYIWILSYCTCGSALDVHEVLLTYLSSFIQLECLKTPQPFWQSARLQVANPGSLLYCTRQGGGTDASQTSVVGRAAS